MDYEKRKRYNRITAWILARIIFVSFVIAMITIGFIIFTAEQSVVHPALVVVLFISTGAMILSILGEMAREVLLNK